MNNKTTPTLTPKQTPYSYCNSPQYLNDIIKVVNSNLPRYHYCLKCLLYSCNRVMDTEEKTYIPIISINGNVKYVPKVKYLFNSLTELGFRQEKVFPSVKEVVKVIEVLLVVNSSKSKTGGIYE